MWEREGEREKLWASYMNAILCERKCNFKAKRPIAWFDKISVRCSSLTFINRVTFSSTFTHKYVCIYIYIELVWLGVAWFGLALSMHRCKASTAKLLHSQDKWAKLTDDKRRHNVQHKFINIGTCVCMPVCDTGHFLRTKVVLSYTWIFDVINLRN